MQDQSIIGALEDKEYQRQLIDQIDSFKDAVNKTQYFVMARSSDEITRLANELNAAELAAYARAINKNLNGLVLPNQESVQELEKQLANYLAQV